MEESVNFYNPPVFGETGAKLNYYIFSNNRIHLEGYQSIKNSQEFHTFNIKLPINVSKITNITFTRYDTISKTMATLKDYSIVFNSGTNSIDVRIEFNYTDTWNGFLFTVDGYI